MVLAYRFKKERLENGMYVSRPRILIELKGQNCSIIIPALIDTGCDITVIPEGIAKAIGLETEGIRGKLYAYREANEVIESKATIIFLGKEHRQMKMLSHVQVLIAIAEENTSEEEDVILGLKGIFDEFDITFKKSQNKIILKEVAKTSVSR